MIRLASAFVVAFTLGFQFGCGQAKIGDTNLPNRGDEEARTDGAGRSNAEEETTPAREPTSQAIAPTTPLTELASISTGTVSLPTDDPVGQGWEVEAFSSAVSERLKHLDELLVAGKDTPHIEPKWVDSSCRIGRLRPANLEQVFKGDSLVVRRLSGTADDSQRSSSEPSQSTGWAQACERWFDDLGPLSRVRTKVKVFGAELRPDGTGATDVYVQVFAAHAKGTIQTSSTWKCEWSASDYSKPLLVSLDVLAYEEVQNDSGQEALFTDCTEPVVDPATFQSQLKYSVDHWLQRVDTSMGIDIGGWQGIAIGDVNGDELEDIYICQPGGLPNRLLIQQPDGTTKDESASAGVDWLESSHAALLIDIDNDLDQDLVVGVSDGVLFMSNNGRGKFTVRAAQLVPAALPYSLAAADYDVDGDLDVYVCCYNRRGGINRHLLFARPMPYHDANNGGRNVLLQNRSVPATGNWKFRYQTHDVGLDENNRRFSYAAAWEDYDNDGDLDLYVANDFGRNNLFRNDEGRFKDVAGEAGVEDIGPGMSACWSDYNNDGLADLYVSNMFSSAGNRITGQSKFQSDADADTREAFRRHARGNSLFKNLGDGKFEDVSLSAGVDLGRWAWGSKFADLNNDGWQDLVVSNGFITQPDSGDL